MPFHNSTQYNHFSCKKAPCHIQVTFLLYYIKCNVVVRFIEELLRFIELSVLHQEISLFTPLTKVWKLSDLFQPKFLQSRYFVWSVRPFYGQPLCQSYRNRTAYYSTYVPWLSFHSAIKVECWHPLYSQNVRAHFYQHDRNLCTCVQY